MSSMKFKCCETGSIKYSNNCEDISDNNYFSHDDASFKLTNKPRETNPTMLDNEGSIALAILPPFDTFLSFLSGHGSVSGRSF